MPPPPHFSEWGGGAKICLCPPPHFQTQNLGLGIEPADICDVTLAWLASRCWARQMCPPPHTHTHILSRSYAVAWLHIHEAQEGSPPLRSQGHCFSRPQVTRSLFFHEKIKTTQVTGRFFKLSRSRGRPQNGPRSQVAKNLSWASYIRIFAFLEYSLVAGLNQLDPVLDLD